MDPIQILRAAANSGDPQAAAMVAQFAANPALSKLFDKPGRQDVRLSRILSDAAPSTPRLLRRDTALFGLAPGDVHIAVGLQNQLQAYTNRPLIADDVLPVVVVQKQQDKIWELPVGTLQTVSNAAIAGQRSKPNELAYSVDANLSYACKPYGFLDPTPLEVLVNADAPIEPRRLSAMVVKSFLDLARENRVATAVFSAGNYGTNTVNLAGAARWDNPASDPIGAILQAKEQVLADVNVLVLGGQVWPFLMTHPNVVKYITGRAGTSIGNVPPLMARKFLAEMLELDDVMVGRAKLVTSNEGAATQTTGYIWGKGAALIRVEPQPNPRATSCFGYTYRWKERAYRHEVITELLHGGMGVEYLKLSHYDAEVVIQSAASANPAGFYWGTAVS